MRVLLAHNFYRSSAPSGENKVVDLEYDLLLKNGIEVIPFFKNSDTIKNSSIGTIKAGLETVWNVNSRKAFLETIERYKPDIVHLHNNFPIISPSIFAAERKVPIVQTMHNYRIFCCNGLLLRNGQVCTKCLDARSAIHGVKYGCYRNSRLASIPLALKITIEREQRQRGNGVNEFIALSNFQKEKLIQGGLSKDNISVKPNFYEGNPKVVPYCTRKRNVVFVGRLSVEKGVTDLLNAWKFWGVGAPDLHLIGSGPLETKLKSDFVNLGNVHFHGQLKSRDTERFISLASLVIMPSVCWEGFPMVLRECFAYGTPVAVSNIGPLPSIVATANGAIFEPNDPSDLWKQIASLFDRDEILEQMSVKSRKTFESYYTREVNFHILENIYKRAIGKFQNEN